MIIPKAYYDNKFEIHFSVRKKTMFYTIFKWNDDGTNRASIHTAKYNNEDPKSLITSEINSREESK